MISIYIPSVPISANHAYVTLRGGKGRMLSSAGKKYKNETKTHIAREYQQELRLFKKDTPYVLLVEFTFKGRDSLMSRTWPEEAKNRYKKVDVSNRLKLLEDALTEATGLDDSQNFSITVRKTWARDYECTRIWVWDAEEERDNPIDELVRRLRETEPH